MLVVIFIFALMSIFYYEYRDSSDDDEDDPDYIEENETHLKLPLPPVDYGIPLPNYGSTNSFDNDSDGIKNRKKPDYDNQGYESKELP